MLQRYDSRREELLASIPHPQRSHKLVLDKIVGTNTLKARANASRL